MLNDPVSVLIRGGRGVLEAIGTLCGCRRSLFSDDERVVGFTIKRIHI